ncbi:T9SS type A sorting domain-containing protein [Desertivirga xinjiangensis]|uniref:T9SS type A sorting domain-containing protein n=1 Tax=Desertivirga xinjiangensis TaxID=539206 RepID=UPI00210C6ED9|nr:T9SS type A sorting domain-containing protein [Pedobacter xinjiangensis]
MKQNYPVLLFILLFFTFNAIAETRTSVQSGPWNNAATWGGAAVPASSDDVIIAAGHTVSLQAASSGKTLQVEGTLAFGSSSGFLTIYGDVTVAAAGNINAYVTTSPATGKPLTVRGNFINNGTVDFSQASANLIMGEPLSKTASSISGTGNFGVIRMLTIDNQFGVNLSSPINISNRLYLTSGVFNNGNNLTLNNSNVGNGPPAPQMIVIRSQLSSLESAFIPGSNVALFIQYTANEDAENAQIVAGYEIPASNSIARLTLENPGGLLLTNDLRLTSSSIALVLTAGIVTVPKEKAITVTNTTVGATLISQGTASSYVDGAIIVTALTTAQIRNIPIGSNGKNRKVVLTGLKSDGSSSALVKFHIEDANGGTPASGTTIANTRRWVGELLSGGVTYTGISIDYNDDDKIKSIVPDLLSKSASSNGSYNILGSGSTTGNSVSSAIGTYTDFGFFALTHTGVLPVVLTSYNLKRETEGIKISWTTGSETNNRHFIIERSSDGRSFTTLQTIEGKGNYIGNSEYIFYDKKPLSGIAYYRLMQVDFDGRTTDLGLESIRYSLESKVELTVYPNPVTDKVSISLTNSPLKLADIAMFDMNGSIAHKEVNVNIENGCQINVDHLRKGQYLIKISGAGYAKVAKVLIN